MTDADVRPMRTVISSLRRKLGEGAENPAHIFTQLRVGYRMPKGRRRHPQTPNEFTYLWRSNSYGTHSGGLH